MLPLFCTWVSLWVCLYQGSGGQSPHSVSKTKTDRIRYVFVLLTPLAPIAGSTLRSDRQRAKIRKEVNNKFGRFIGLTLFTINKKRMMKMKFISRSIFMVAAILAVLAFIAGPVSAAEAKKPNILVIWG